MLKFYTFTRTLGVPSAEIIPFEPDAVNTDAGKSKW